MWRSRSEAGVDAERPARSGEDEEKSLLGRVAAGDFLSHAEQGVTVSGHRSKTSWVPAQTKGAPGCLKSLVWEKQQGLSASSSSVKVSH